MTPLPLHQRHSFNRFFGIGEVATLFISAIGKDRIHVILNGDVTLAYKRGTVGTEQRYILPVIEEEIRAEFDLDKKRTQVFEIDGEKVQITLEEIGLIQLPGSTFYYPTFKAWKV